MDELLEQVWQENQKGSITVNKTLIKELGYDAALLMGELLSRFRYFHNGGRLQDGYFYNSIPDLESGTGMGRKQQQRVIKKLQAANLIQVYKGYKHTRQFKINLEELQRLIGKHKTREYVQKGQGMLPETTEYVQKGQFEMSQTDNSECPKRTTNNYKNNYEYKREGDSTTEECLNRYKQLFEKHTGREAYTSKADAKILKDIIDVKGLEETKQLLEKYFLKAENDKFIRDKGYPLRLFSSQLNSLLVEEPKPRSHMTREEQVARGLLSE